MHLTSTLRGHLTDQLGVPLAAVHEAMAYHYGNTEEIRTFEDENADTLELIGDVCRRVPTGESFISNVSHADPDPLYSGFPAENLVVTCL